MKKIISFIISVMLICACALGLTACGDVKDGVSVENAYFDGDGNLIIKLTDGKEINCGAVNPEPYENFYFTEVTEDGNTTYTVRSIGAVSDAEIVIPSTYKGKPVTAIGESAFFNCKYITGVTIPDSVKTIGDYAFNGCENLKKAELGQGVETLGDGAFAYCHSLEKIKIPSSVRTVGADAFCDCYALTEAVIENGVERMGRSVFTGCTMLEEVIMPDSISGGADGDDYSMYAMFMNCYSLKYVKVPANLEFLPQSFFSGCFALEKVNLGKQLKKVGYSAFFGNGALTSLILPATLKECESYAFYKLNALESVYFEGTAAEWAEIKVVRSEGSGDIDEYSLSRAADGRAVKAPFDESVTIYFYSETQPTDAGNFWHYDADGETPLIWN